MIIIGLGSGRCGTRSLASLLNAQADTVCFHEVNPSCMAWTGTERTVLSMLEEFRAVLAGGPRQITVDLATRRRGTAAATAPLEAVRAIGDVASYYLPYAPMLAEMPDVRMPVLRRDKDATVASFIQVMRIRRGRIRTVIDGVATLLRRRPYRRFRNHWVEHDGRRYRRSVKFDKCFPKFQAKTVEDARAILGSLLPHGRGARGQIPGEDPDLRSRRPEHAVWAARHLGILRAAPAGLSFRQRQRQRADGRPDAGGGCRCRINGSRGWMMTSQDIEHQLVPALDVGIDAAQRPRSVRPGCGPTRSEARRRAKPAGAVDTAGHLEGMSAPSPPRLPDQDPAAIAKVVLCICAARWGSRLLEAVAELDFAGKLAVVVVDNDAAGAAEGLAVCGRMAAAGYRWPLTCAPEERRGIPFARNRAIALALEQDPDFIAALDDDERPSPGWLGRCCGSRPRPAPTPSAARCFPSLRRTPRPG